MHGWQGFGFGRQGFGLHGCGLHGGLWQLPPFRSVWPAVWLWSFDCEPVDTFVADESASALLDWWPGPH